MDKEITYYLAGPMTGYPKFNFPLFLGTAKLLRKHGYSIISPAELDSPESKAHAMRSRKGIANSHPDTWGQMLGRDIEIIADKCKGMLLLPGWERSSGAKLEAMCGLLLDFKFYSVRDRYGEQRITKLLPITVMNLIKRNVL